MSGNDRKTRYLHIGFKNGKMRVKYFFFNLFTDTKVDVHPDPWGSESTHLLNLK